MAVDGPFFMDIQTVRFGSEVDCRISRNNCRFTIENTGNGSDETGILAFLRWILMDFVLFRPPVFSIVKRQKLRGVREYSRQRRVNTRD